LKEHAIVPRHPCATAKKLPQQPRHPSDERRKTELLSSI